MTKSKILNSSVTHVGSMGNHHHVLQSLASISLAGLHPSEETISLVILIANEKITVEEAIKIVKSWHQH